MLFLDAAAIEEAETEAEAERVKAETAEAYNEVTNPLPTNSRLPNPTPNFSTLKNPNSKLKPPSPDLNPNSNPNHNPNRRWVLPLTLRVTSKRPTAS